MAELAPPTKAQAEQAEKGRGCACAATEQCSPNPSCASAIQTLTGALPVGALLIARIYEVFPLVCPICDGQMLLIAFITHSVLIRQILDHIGADSEPPHISLVRGPPLWDGSGVQMDDGVQIEPDWDLAAQPAQDFDVDQCVNW